MRDIWLDVRYAARALRASFAPTLSAIATLALGIGMTVSIFSVINGVVLRPLPFPRDDRLVSVCERYPGSTADRCGIAPPNAEDIAARSHNIAAIGIGRGWPFHITTTSGQEPISGGLATPELFHALGVRAEFGRLIERTDLLGRPSAVALLSHEAWITRFGGRADVLGQAVRVDDQMVTIIGVLPRGVNVPQIGSPELWRPLHINPRDEQHRTWRGFVAFARLRDGASLADTRRELAGLSRELRNEHFVNTPDWGLRVLPSRDLLIGGIRPMLYVFLGGVGLVLLIGCANVANLQLARSVARSREMAVRAALGASPSRIVRALLIESTILALAGGILGIGLATAATRAFKAFAPPAIPRLELVSIDGRVVLFAVALSVMTVLIFGTVPALRVGRASQMTILREGGRNLAGHRGRLGSALVVGELALAVVLVATAGLLTRTFVALGAWNPGFDREQVLTFSVFASEATYPDRSAITGLWRRLEQDLAAIPGVAAVATASAGPLFGAHETWEMEFEGEGTRGKQSVRWYDASPNYFRALGVPIVRGRSLSEQDDDPSGVLVGVVNESLARRFWPGQDPIGKTLVFPVGSSRNEFRVVGVARDIPPLRRDEPIEAQLFWSNRQLPRGFTYFIVRTSLPPASLVGTIQSRIKAIDRDLGGRSFQTLDDRMHDELTTPRFSMLLVGCFGVAALLFAAIGTYGLLNYTIAQRTREMGIRIALGAEPGKVLLGVVRDGTRLAMIGTAVGLGVTAALGRVLRTMVVGVGVADPVALGSAAAIIVLVAAVACVGPAWRASRVDPATTLSE